MLAALANDALRTGSGSGDAGKPTIDDGTTM
jgi:hypothetical protein